MIRHIALMKFNPEFSIASREEWARAARQMPAQIAEIRSFSLGFDVLNSERSWDAAVVVDFDKIEDVKVYADHPAHRPVAALSMPNCEDMVFVDFELDAAD